MKYYAGKRLIDLFMFDKLFNLEPKIPDGYYLFSKNLIDWYTYDNDNAEWTKVFEGRLDQMDHEDEDLYNMIIENGFHHDDLVNMNVDVFGEFWKEQDYDPNFLGIAYAFDEDLPFEFIQKFKTLANYKNSARISMPADVYLKIADSNFNYRFIPPIPYDATSYDIIVSDEPDTTDGLPDNYFGFYDETIESTTDELINAIFSDINFVVKDEALITSDDSVVVYWNIESNYSIYDSFVSDVNFVVKDEALITSDDSVVVYWNIESNYSIEDTYDTNNVILIETSDAYTNVDDFIIMNPISSDYLIRDTYDTNNVILIETSNAYTNVDDFIIMNPISSDYLIRDTYDTNNVILIETSNAYAA